MRVDAVGDHAVVDRPASRDLAAGEQAHEVRVPVVKLERQPRTGGHQGRRRVQVHQSID